MARTRLLGLLGHEPGQGAAGGALRLNQQPQFRGTAGAGIADASAVARDGSGGGGDRAAGGCAGVGGVSWWGDLAAQITPF